MADTTTRSGMLWEVERILTECEEKPQILLMENVPQVHSQDNIEDFNKWQYSLEKMGYKNYWQDLIATDYGIPQTRNRCFMVSILGKYNYKFPQPIPLEKKLKDLLEDNVDEKYYLSDEMIKYIVSDNENYTGNNNKSIINRDIATTITTREGNGRADTSDYICNDRGGNYNLKKEFRDGYP
jgi:DNA (cytosine-5)-methyltransferase 1